MSDLIQGVKLEPKRQIPDARGTVRTFIDNENFCSCYTTTVYKGVIKGWHGYYYKTLQYTVPIGMIKLVLKDVRSTSDTYLEINEFYLGTENYQRITIPPGVMNAFQGIADPLSLAVVVADEKYDEKRMFRFPIDYFDYDWSKVNG